MNHVDPDFPAHGLNGGVSTRTYIATHAMMGLLADHKDHEDERLWHYQPCSQNDEGAEVICVDGKYSYRRKIFVETCEQAVARLAVQHADALIAELNEQPTGGAS